MRTLHPFAFRPFVTGLAASFLACSLASAGQVAAPAGLQPVWAGSGSAIAAGNQPHHPILVADGDGGAFVLWQTADPAGISARKLSRSGIPEWPGDALVVHSGAAGGFLEVAACGDGLGGAVAVWVERDASGSKRLFAQRVTARGELVWGEAGIAIAPEIAGDQRHVRVLLTGPGLVTAIWENRAARPKILARTIDFKGRAGDHPIVTIGGIDAGTSVRPVADATDGLGGFVVSTPVESGPDAGLVTRGFDRDGNIVFTHDIPGDRIATATATILGRQDGGATLSFIAREHDALAIAIERIGADGTGIWSHRVALSADGVMPVPILTSDGLGGVIGAWAVNATPANRTIRATSETGADSRNRNDSVRDAVRVARWNDRGEPLWAEDGLVILSSTGPGTQIPVGLFATGDGGATVVWRITDETGGVSFHARILDRDGAVLPPSGSDELLRTLSAHASATLLEDSGSGFFLAWDDVRSGTASGVFAQRFAAPAPAATTKPVSIQNFSFSPATLNITVGDTVQWNWNGGTHSTRSGGCSGGTCTADGVWDSTVKSSGNFSRIFDTVGTFPYHCMVHGASMQGTVVVALPPPLSCGATATPQAGEVTLTTTLDAHPAGGAAPYAVSWDLGDGGTSGVNPVVHDYPNAGIFHAAASVTDAELTVCMTSVDVAASPCAGRTLTSATLKGKKKRTLTILGSGFVTGDVAQVSTDGVNWIDLAGKVKPTKIKVKNFQLVIATTGVPISVRVVKPDGCASTPIETVS